MVRQLQGMDACKLQLLMAAVWLVVVLGLVQAVLAQPPEQLQNNGSIDSPLCSLARRSLLTQEEFERYLTSLSPGPSVSMRAASKSDGVASCLACTRRGSLLS